MSRVLLVLAQTQAASRRETMVAWSVLWFLHSVVVPYINHRSQPLVMFICSPEVCRILMRWHDSTECFFSSNPASKAESFAGITTIGRWSGCRACKALRLVFHRCRQGRSHRISCDVCCIYVVLATHSLRIFEFKGFKGSLVICVDEFDLFFRRISWHMWRSFVAPTGRRLCWHNMGPLVLKSRQGFSTFTSSICIYSRYMSIYDEEKYPLSIS